ncbi:MAG: FkbM family methyltransferase [Cytophagales bacterium]|nr:FkbM family methyltransferase [Cytophagales bacterium]
MKNLFFIQIGSNDGKTNDPIHEFIKGYNWKGILVEPVEYLFNRLLTTYAGCAEMRFENLAINARKGTRRFYQLKATTDPDVPSWSSLLGSFRKSVVLKNIGSAPGLKKYLFSEKVNCISFKSLLRKHGVTKIDFLHIDTEGYDYEVIKSIPFRELKPQLILFEHLHLTRTEYDKCIRLLHRNHYSVTDLNNGYDSIASLG